MFAFLFFLFGAMVLVAAVAGLFNRQVRCPNCTQRLNAARWTEDLACPKCGTQILRAGEFVQARTTEQK